MPTDYEAHTAQRFSGVESTACQPSGPTLLGGPLLLPFSSGSPLVHLSSVCVSVPACLMPTSPVSTIPFLTLIPAPRVLSHQSQPMVAVEDRPCREDYLPVQTKGVFFVHRPVIRLQRDRSLNIHLCVCSKLPTLPGPLALFYSNNITVGGKSPGMGREMLTAPRPS